MKNLKSVLFVICVIGCILLAGCSRDESGDIAGRLKAGAEASKGQETPKEQETVKEPQEDTEEEEKDAGVPEVLSGEALYYDGKIMFRVYSYAAYEYGALFGEFSHNDHPYQPNTIYTFDPKDAGKGISKLCDDNGTGMMYLINGTDLYSQYKAEGPQDADQNRVYKRHLPDGEEDEICNGEIKGFSPDGSHFVVYTYTYDEYMQHYYIYSAGDVDVDTAHYESGTNITYLGMDNDAAYFLAENDGGTYDVIKLTNDGSRYCLATCDFGSVNEQYAMDYPQYDGLIVFDDESLTFQTDFYEGTGHFYYGSVAVEVPTAAEGGSSDAPLYGAMMRELVPDKDEDGAPIDPEAFIPPSLKELAHDFPSYESGRGTANVLQYYTSFDEGIFYCVAQCHRYPLDDIGWRESYGLQNVRYRFLPAGQSDPVLLHTMFEPLGKRGCLAKYEYYERQPTEYVYAQFLPDKDGSLKGVLYETINVQGPEMPIETSDVYNIAEFADEVYYEHPHDDELYEDFDVEGMKEFADMIYSYPQYGSPAPVKDAVFDPAGALAFDPSMSIKDGESIYMCHIAFDAEGRVYYIRPVIME